MIFKLRKTKRKEMIIYIGSGHMTGGCVTVRDTRYGFSIDYTDPYPSGWQSHPIWVSCPNSGTHSRSFLAKEDAGLRAPPSAHAPSTCTATCSMHMPIPWGSNAPVWRIEEEVLSGSMLLHPYHEPRARAHPGCYQYIYMYPQLVSSYAACAKLSPLGRFWCWPGLQESGPVAGICVNWRSPIEYTFFSSAT